MQTILDLDNLIVSFCTGEAHVLTSEVIKVIPLNRGQHVQLKSDVREPRYAVETHVLMITYFIKYL